MDDKRLTDHVREWTSLELGWDEEQIVWLAAHDGGETLEYFTRLVEKMRAAEREYLELRESFE